MTTTITTTTHAYQTMVCVFIIQNKEHCFLSMVMLQGFLQLSISARMLSIRQFTEGGWGGGGGGGWQQLDQLKL